MPVDTLYRNNAQLNSKPNKLKKAIVKKLYTAAFLTETADLDRTPISMTAEEWTIARHGSYKKERSKFGDILLLFRDMAEAKGWAVAEGPCAVGFPPSGRIIHSVYENMRSMILEDLQKAMPVDAVLLQLHGAAMAHGYDDCEGDLLEHIRQITGPDIPIGVELDPHCHMTDKMVNHSTAIVLYKTFAHTDVAERAAELFTIIAETLEEKINPVMAVFDCRMIDSFDEIGMPAMKAFLDTVYEGERREGILSISPVHGFSLADVADMGCKMLVIANDDLDLARKTAKEFGRAFYDIRGQLLTHFKTIDEDLNAAQQSASKGEPVLLVEYGDLAGCGFPTDSTEVIQAMLQRGMDNVAVGMLWDPQAVSICHEVGAGTELVLRIGGKISPSSGIPLDLNVVVERVYKNITITNYAGEENPCHAAVVRSGSTELCLVSKRLLPCGLQPFRDLGIEPKDKQYLLTKWIGDLNDPDSREGRDIIYLAGSRLDYKTWPIKHINRPKWPWDENPFDEN